MSGMRGTGMDEKLNKTEMGDENMGLEWMMRLKRTKRGKEDECEIWVRKVNKTGKGEEGEQN